MSWSRLVDMSMDDEDILDMCCPIPIKDKPRYPYGLRICLTHKELEKLGLTPDCEIGDMVDLRCFAVVTSMSIDETQSGPTCRVELQIEKMMVENEMTEKD
jgi:hypothetical protein